MSTRMLRAALVAVGAILVPAAALAHPLGNFTINHHSGLRVEPDRIVVDHVLDLAEIPTFSAFREVDTDGDGTASDTERAAAAQARCGEQAAAVSLTVDGAAAPLSVTGSALSFPMGSGAPTMRLVCRLEASGATAAAAVTFADPTFPERAGWREIVVAGDRMTVRGEVAATSPSDRLTTYPSGLLAQAPDQRSVAFSVAAGGPALPALVQPELTGGATAPADPTASVPGGSTELSGELAALFQASELTPWVLFLSLLAAAGLGALHALSPGHGKTVMAAYLVGSRGTSRQAIGLGATVTASHTLGVLALGLVSLSASTVIAPERLYPILGVISGGIVIAIAGWLLLGVARRWWATRAAERAHAAAHAHGHDHDHGHDHAPAHEHHARAHGHHAQAHAHEGQADPDHDHASAHAHPHPHPHAHGARHAATHSHASAPQDGDGNHATGVHHHHGDPSAAQHDHGAQHAADHDHRHIAAQHGDGDHATGDHHHGHASAPQHDHAEHRPAGHHPEPAATTEDAAGGWHSHGGLRHTHLPSSPEPLRWRGLFALGLAGGMVPSVSAIILLLGSIAAGRPAYGIALTIAFGAGMALVLVGIGVGLVHARGLLDRLPSRWPGRSVGRLLPAGSAAVMLVAGVLITTQAALTLR